MTPLKLQDFLVGVKGKDNDYVGGLLEHILKNFKTINNEPFKIFDNTPVQRETANDKSIYPYCFSALGNGEDNDEICKQQVIIVIATRDIDVNFSGYRDCMNAIQKIREFFLKFPQGNDEILEKSEGTFFEVLKPIKWISPEQSDKSPIFIGGLELTFQLPTIFRYDPNI